ncbi:MAG: hypothetical protein HZA14_10640 [Nitrospirae bacterium]|nr:hypothetical protein [Nitrospirota bacterium]
MKIYSLNLIVLSLAALLLNTPAVSFAVDKEGCLTCHKYPGLVKFEKPDRVRVLHIDEEEHLASKHGKVDCKQCHTKVQQIPHVDAAEVECTTQCHQEDKDKIKAVDASALSKYHEKEKFAITRLDDKTSCRVCHPLYPHSRNKKVRAFLNMHTGYTLCEVCHLKKENLKNLTYEWKEPEHFEFTGEPYGTHHKREAAEEKEESEDEGVISKMLKIFSAKEESAEGTKKTEYLISRIAVFSSEKGEKKVLMNTGDNERAREFLAKEKNMNPQDRDNELKFFHRDIARKEISVACNECHSPNGIIDFKKIGFNDKKVKDLQYLNIKSLITKYETFILPNLFGP